MRIAADTGVLCIGYHYVRDKHDIPYPGIHPLTPQAFSDQLDVLAEQAPPVAPRDVDAWFAGKADLPERSSLLSFDDGMKDHAMAALDVLSPRGMLGAFFICSRPYLEQHALAVHKIHWLRAHTPPVDYRESLFNSLEPRWRETYEAPTDDVVAKIKNTYQFDDFDTAKLKFLMNFLIPEADMDNATTRMLGEHGMDEATFCDMFYLSRDEIRAMHAAGHLIASHTHSHRTLSSLDQDRSDQEIRLNLDFIESVTGERPDWISYPYGSDAALPTDPTAFCGRHGFKLGISYTRGWNQRDTNPAKLLRVDTNEVDRFLTTP